MASEALGVWAAWDGFRQAKVGVGADTAMRAHCPPVADMMRELAAKYPDVRAREDRRAGYAGDLERAWGGGLGEGPNW